MDEILAIASMIIFQNLNCNNWLIWLYIKRNSICCAFFVLYCNKLIYWRWWTCPGLLFPFAAPSMCWVPGPSLKNMNESWEEQEWVKATSDQSAERFIAGPTVKAVPTRRTSGIKKNNPQLTPPVQFRRGPACWKYLVRLDYFWAQRI